MGGAHPRHVGQVLDRHGQSRQAATFTAGALHQPAGLLAGALEAQDGKRVERTVYGGYAGR